MATTIQPAPMSNIQNLDISTPALLSAEEKRALIEDLRVAYGSYKRSVIEVGRILTALRDGTKHGEWEKFLAVIIGDLKISRASAHNFMRAYAEAQFLPEPVVVACEQAGLNLEKTAVRKRVADSIASSPDATPEEIVVSATAKFPAADLRRPANPAIEQLAALRKQFPTRQIERVGGVLNGYERTEFQVWADGVEASSAPTGQDKVTVVLTFNQLRTVQGKVAVGINNVSAEDAEKFLMLWEPR